jgi:ATP-dependent helicase/DNAse subunit B
LSEAIAISDEISETVLEEMLEQREVRENRLWEIDKRDIKKRVVNLLRAEVEGNSEPAARPMAFEKRFGRFGEPPLVVATTAGKVKFTGIIDRLDEREDGLVVIDYKTRRTPIHQREAMEGRNLQLPIYLMAATHLGPADKPVAGGYYLHISSCRRGSEFPNDSVSVEAVTERARAYIGEYVARIRGAEFPVEPTVRDCDSSCSYNVMCRIQSLGAVRKEE